MASGASPPLGKELVGRRAEIAVLTSSLAAASGGAARFVLIKGEEGIGKSELLRWCRAMARDAALLHASGDDFETRLPYGVIEQLNQSSPSPRSAADAAWRASPLPEPAVVGSGLLKQLRNLQQAVPVVVLVDDAHLADPLSQKALLFALRRLESSRLLAVLTVREGGDARLLHGMRDLLSGDAGTTISLGGLGEAAVRELLQGLGLSIGSRRTVRRVREHTRGNPRLLLELVDELGVDGIHGSPHVLWPAPKSVAEPILERLAACPSEAQRLVAATAVIGLRCPLALARKVADVEQSIHALQAALDAHLLEYEARHVAFPHPLVRAAVYHSLAVRERSQLHLRAADLSDDEDDALRHRAAGAIEEDEPLATDFEAYACREISRGSWSCAAAILEEAARLLPRGSRASRDVMDAVECHLMVGNVDAARALADKVDPLDQPARAQYLAGLMAFSHGMVEEASLKLLTARETNVAAGDRHLESRIAIALSRLDLHLLRGPDAVRWAREATSAASGTPWATWPLPYLVLGLAMSGEPDKAIATLRARCEPRREPGLQYASWLLARVIAEIYAGQLIEASHDAADLASLTTTSEELGSLWAPLGELTFVALAEYRVGAWEEAVVQSRRATDLAEDSPVMLPASLASAVWPLAGQGRWDEAEVSASRALRAATTPLGQTLALMADAAIGRARNEPHRVIDSIAVLRSVGPSVAIDLPTGLWPWQELLIDSLVAASRSDEAEDELDRFEHLVAAHGTPVLACQASRLRGKLEMSRRRRREAETAFRRALDHSADLPAPFERALTHADYGAFLRRIGKRSAAAAQLRLARAGFAQVGASPFLERCEQELALTASGGRRRRPTDPDALTPQERSVVDLVVQGKRNREVAAALVVSINTVEYHLKNIYAKLGIGSRSQLILTMRRPPDGLSGNLVGTQ